ncbi:hypothetical protein FKP32DRAFT_1581886, partial [Trametes sanguinea]
GHMGSHTSTYTANTLPGKFRYELERLVRKEFGGEMNRDNCLTSSSSVATMLQTEVIRFDRSLKKDIHKLCSNPEDLSEEDAKRLIREHEEVFRRGFEGTTLSLALINLGLRLLWAIGVGDSTVALSTMDSTGKRSAQRLCRCHTFNDPKEYFRTVIAHKSSERDVVDSHNRVLGMLNMSCAIGDLPLNMHSAYSSHLFRYKPRPTGDHALSPRFIDRLVSPPYLTAKPSAVFVDLDPLWQQDPIILLFTDGIDRLVDGSRVFSRGVSSHARPLTIVPALLPGPSFDAHMGDVLGHPVEHGWSREEQNMAVDVLGNLLGGADAERLEIVLDRDRLRAEYPSIAIDDATMLVARLGAA